jgi:hypothetical protein
MLLKVVRCRKLLGLVAVIAVGVLCNGCINRQPHPKVQRLEKILTGGGKIVFEGYYKDGSVIEHGRCVFTETDGLRCEMYYKHGLANGKCRWYYPDGSLAFDGKYRDDKPWDGILIPIGMCSGAPNKYKAGEECEVWKDPRGIFVD